MKKSGLFIVSCVVVASAMLTVSGCSQFESKDQLVGISEADAVIVKGARALIERMTPQHSDQFSIEVIPAEKGHDVFELDGKAGKVILRGNNVVSIASAFNYYLKYTVNAHISWNCGNQLALPGTLPAPVAIRTVSPHLFRPIYNYCTHGYTMPWWDFEQWEKELDYLAMNGLNMALIIQGQEQIWINTLMRLGYTEKEVLAWLVVPTHQPWMYMSNLESYGGPVPKSLPPKRVELVKKMIRRMDELGIKPILQGYYGIVPKGFAERFPGTKVHEQGLWGNRSVRPAMLDPTDSMFQKVAGIFYDEQRRLYGQLDYLAADPFHEGGKTDGMDVAQCGKLIQDEMFKAQPNATWVIQAWEHNPMPKLLSQLDKKKVLVIDLYEEAVNSWKSRKGFEGTPWVWAVISNFGGNTGMDGTLKGIGKTPSEVLTDPDRGPYSGIGAVPEGSQTNPVIWDLHFENTWRNAPLKDVNGWVDAYAMRRYGAKSDAAERAWGHLLNSVYSRELGRNGGGVPTQTVMNGRPEMNSNMRARWWVHATVTPHYQSKLNELYKGWEALLSAAEECQRSDGYRYDVVDLTRQVMCDAATQIHKKYIDAYKAKDVQQVKALSAKMLGLFDDLEQVLNTRREFMFGSWLSDARRWGDTPEEKSLYEWNSKVLLTIWSEPSYTLPDYANRSWGGLVKYFYKQRWQMFYDTMNAALEKNESVDEKALRETLRAWETVWTHQTDHEFPVKPSGDEIAIAKEIFKKYTYKDLFE